MIFIPLPVQTFITHLDNIFNFLMFLHTLVSDIFTSSLPFNSCNLFIQQIFIEHKFYIKHCARFWWYINEWEIGK